MQVLTGRFKCLGERRGCEHQIVRWNNLLVLNASWMSESLQQYPMDRIKIGVVLLDTTIVRIYPDSTGRADGEVTILELRIH